MPTVSKEELLRMAGTAVEPSAWLRIDQDRIHLFADATGDHQYIHIDPEKASKTPFGSTIAHGFLSLSLLPHLSEEVAVRPEGVQMVINYGLNKVRFLQPVKVGSEVRLVSKIADVVEKKPGHILITTDAAVEIRGEEKPALVAEMLLMYVVG
jgi:acyl dehydratase